MAQGDDGSVWLGPWEFSCLARTPSHPPKSQGDREGTSGGGPRTRGLKHQLPTASQPFPRWLLGAESGLTGREAGGAGSRTRPAGTSWASRREQGKANQEGDWIPTDLHMWGVWALHRDTPTELFSVPKTKLVCTKPEVTIPLASAEVGRNRILAGRGVGEDGIWKSTSPWRKIPNYGRKEKSSAWVRKM